MEASDVGRTCDILRMAAFGGDPAIEALSYLSDNQVGLDLKGQVQRQHVARVIGHRRGGFPPTGAVHLQPDIRPVIIMHADGGVLAGQARGNRAHQVPGGAAVDRGAKVNHLRSLNTLDRTCTRRNAACSS